MTDRIKALEDALRPFSRVAGEMFARNWNRDDVAILFDGECEEIRLTFADFLSARAALAASQPAQPVAVKPLEWGPYPNPVFAGPDISVANVSGAVISYYYQAGRDPDAPGYYVFAAPTHGTLQWRSAGYASIEAAKAAAQADYEARIMAALDVQPLTVQDAARVLLTAREQGQIDVEAVKLFLKGQPAAALRAIVEGRA